MTEIQEIDLYIQDDGSVRIEVRGVKGPKCLEITKELEELLGADIVSRELTDESAEHAQSEERPQRS
jgi:hypothetical protein